MTSLLSSRQGRSDLCTDLERAVGLAELAGVGHVGDVGLRQRIAVAGAAVHEGTQKEEERVFGEGGDDLPGSQAQARQSPGKKKRVDDRMRECS